jgi:hypothetical protein
MPATFGKQQVVVKRAKMEIDAPLKPPEYKRNNLGQFDRPGKTLAKTAKKKTNKTGLIKKTDEINREPDGRYKNGGARPGAGRPKGSKNKLSLALKDAILQAGENAGGDEGLVGYLSRLAVENSSAYASLLKGVLPMTLASDSDDGEQRHITFTRIIVHADGHREIKPKQLPPPASPVLPIEDVVTSSSNSIKDLD